jgi:hypothetical protein
LHNVVARNDGFTIELREINHQKRARGPNAVKHENTFLPGTAGPRRVAGGVVPAYLAQAESRLPGLHGMVTTNPTEWQRLVADRLEVGHYASAIRSGPNRSRARWHQKAANDSVYTRAGFEAFTILEQGVTLFASMIMHV